MPLARFVPCFLFSNDERSSFVFSLYVRCKVIASIASFLLFFVNASIIFISILECPLCKYKSNSKEPFYTLNLEINYDNLNTCIKDFLNEEKLDNNNYWKCTKCKN